MSGQKKKAVSIMGRVMALSIKARSRRQRRRGSLNRVYPGEFNFVDKKNRDRSARSSMHRDDTIDQVLWSWEKQGKIVAFQSDITGFGEYLYQSITRPRLEFFSSCIYVCVCMCIQHFSKDRSFFLFLFLFLFSTIHEQTPPPGAGLKSVEREREGKGEGADNDEQIKGQTQTIQV